MLKKYISKISFIMTLIIVLQVTRPTIFHATNLSKVDLNNGEVILFSLDGYTYTSIENDNFGTIKTYKDDVTLIEDITINKNTGMVSKLNYIENSNNVFVENIEKYNINQKFDVDADIMSIENEIQNIKLRSSRIGSATFRVRDWIQQYASMDVYYEETFKETTHRVRSFKGTVGEIILYLCGLFVIPHFIGSSIVKQLIADGLIVVSGSVIGEAFFSLNADKRIRKYTGIDCSNSNYESYIVGSEIIIKESEHKRIGEVYYEGIHFYPEDWGRLRISEALAPSVYRALYSKMTLVNEGR